MNGKKHIQTPLRRWCVRCNQPKELRGGKLNRKRGTFTCAGCK